MSASSCYNGIGLLSHYAIVAGGLRLVPYSFCVVILIISVKLSVKLQLIKTILVSVIVQINNRYINITLNIYLLKKDEMARNQYSYNLALGKH